MYQSSVIVKQLLEFQSRKTISVFGIQIPCPNIIPIKNQL